MKIKFNSSDINDSSWHNITPSISMKKHLNVFVSSGWYHTHVSIVIDRTNTIKYHLTSIDKTDSGQGDGCILILGTF